MQAGSLNSFLRRAVVMPCTSNLRWAEFPRCVRLAAGEGGLTNESAVLTHQLRVIDGTRLVRRWEFFRARYCVKSKRRCC